MNVPLAMFVFAGVVGAGALADWERVLITV